jgi:glycosyltransferase involved in cell wall biosynthesis
MRILIVSDAWAPQVNGVVTCLRALVSELEALGHQVCLLSPADFRSDPARPTRKSSVLGPLAGRREDPRLRPDCVHADRRAAGLGRAALAGASRMGLYLGHPHALSGIPEHPLALAALAIGYAFLRRFHAPSAAVLVSSERMRQAFAERGVAHLALWRKGVDVGVFQPSVFPRGAAVFLYVGRLAPEKNLEAFLRLDLPGRKRVVGDGPQRAELQARYPQWNSSVTAMALSWPRPTAAPACWCFRRSPIPSGWSCTKPWPAARQWPPSRWPGHWMC